MHETHKTAAGLPPLCYAISPSDGGAVIIRRGVNGYFPAHLGTADRDAHRRAVALMNERLGVTTAQRDAMLCGSMFGWHVPGANPRYNPEAQGR